MLSNEEDLWATFGLTYDPKMEAQIALDDELAGLEAANRVGGGTPLAIEFLMSGIPPNFPPAGAAPAAARAAVAGTAAGGHCRVWALVL